MLYYTFFYILISLYSTLLSIFILEKLDALYLFDMPIGETIFYNNSIYNLDWEELNYPSLYTIDTYLQTNKNSISYQSLQHIKTNYTTLSQYDVLTDSRTYAYNISVYGLFHKLTKHPKYIEENAPDIIRPVSITKFAANKKTNSRPYIIWHTIADAVCYELEILSAPPEYEGGVNLSTKNHLYSTKSIFTNGWQANLDDFRNYDKLYWRVRALTLHHQPIGEFSIAEPIYIDYKSNAVNIPLPNTFEQNSDFRQPLYPVYQWIPLNGIKSYEVEVMTSIPPKDYNNLPYPGSMWSKRITLANAIYDEYARPYAGSYYWRVRGLNENGLPIGEWSEPANYTVETINDRPLAAAFGDSITHGGGAISFSPAFLEYSFTSYLSFKCINLGRSGDTSYTTLARFDEDVVPFNPLNLLILTGSNSIRDENISAQDIINDLRNIGNKCLVNDIRPVFLTLLPLNPQNITTAFNTPTDYNWHYKLQEVNSWIREQTYYIDLEPYFYDDNENILNTSISTDGLHPDVYGKQLMGNIINYNINRLKY